MHRGQSQLWIHTQCHGKTLDNGSADFPLHFPHCQYFCEPVASLSPLKLIRLLISFRTVVDCIGSRRLYLIRHRQSQHNQNKVPYPIVSSPLKPWTRKRQTWLSWTRPPHISETLSIILLTVKALRVTSASCPPPKYTPNLRRFNTATRGDLNEIKFYIAAQHTQVLWTLVSILLTCSHLSHISSAR